MKQRLQEVRIEDFDIAALRRAAREGRLYIEPSAECETNIEQEVLAYVSRIAEQAAPPYRECIDEMWRRIVNDPLLAPLLKTRKGPFCKYSVTAIAILLNNRGVYTYGSGVALHLQLEGIAERNKYYKNSMKYAPDDKGYKALCGIIRNALEKKL
jgi:hypothetical protein